MSPAAAPAQSNLPPPRAERREFDPQSEEWVRIAAPVAGTEEGDLQLARSMLAREQFAAARASLKTWRKKYPGTARWPEGLFYSADTEVAAVQAGQNGDLWQAYKWYEEILNSWAGTEWSDKSMRREIIVAEMFLFKKIKRKVWGGAIRVTATDEAIEMLNRLADDRAPGTKIAEQAIRLKGDYFFQAGEFEDAEDAYARLARDFPRGPFERQALLRSADAALASFPGVKFDDRSLLNADERYRKYVAQFPDAAAAEGVAQRVTRIAESRAEKELMVAQFYERTHVRNAAIYYYDFVVKNWPETAAGAQARARLITIAPAPAVTPATEPAATTAPTAGG